MHSRLRLYTPTPGSFGGSEVAVPAAGLVAAHEAVGQKHVPDGDAGAGEGAGHVRAHPGRGKIHGLHAEALEADVDPNPEADTPRGRARAVEVLRKE